MRHTFTFLFLCLALGLQAQQTYNSGWGGSTTRVRGNGDVITEERSVRSFSGVEVCCGLKVELREGSFDVKVEAESNIAEYVRTEVSGDRLEIGFKGKVNLKTTKDIVVYVSLPRLAYASVSSASKIIGKTPFRGEDLELNASSGAKVMLDFSGDRVRAGASSGGRVELAGKGSRIKANASSGGSVRAGDFTAQRGDANASSGGGVTLHVTEELEADASSGGGVKYYGNPANVDSDRSSGGSVRKVNSPL